MPLDPDEPEVPDEPLDPEVPVAPAVLVFMLPLPSIVRKVESLPAGTPVNCKLEPVIVPRNLPFPL